MTTSIINEDMMMMMMINR